MYGLSNTHRDKLPDLKEKLSRLNEDRLPTLAAKIEDKSEAAHKLKGVKEGEGAHL